MTIINMYHKLSMALRERADKEQLNSPYEYTDKQWAYKFALSLSSLSFSSQGEAIIILNNYIAPNIK